MAGNIKKILDDFGIKAGDRPMWLKLNVASGWTAAGILLYLFLKCSESRVSDTHAAAQAADEMKRRIEEAASVRVEREMRNIMQALEFNRRALDTASKKLDTLKSSI